MNANSSQPDVPASPTHPCHHAKPCAHAGQTFDQNTGIIIVDHGSRRPESNLMLEAIVETFAEQSQFAIVEPAHMELAEPSIATAFTRCVQRGANKIVVMPYFLLPGKHWNEDIPRLTREAAEKHPGIKYMVTAPLGMHPMIHQVMEARINHCLDHVGGKAPSCQVCEGSDRCRMESQQ